MGGATTLDWDVPLMQTRTRPSKLGWAIIGWRVLGNLQSINLHDGVWLLMPLHIWLTVSLMKGSWSGAIFWMMYKTQIDPAGTRSNAGLTTKTDLSYNKGRLAAIHDWDRSHLLIHLNPWLMELERPVGFRKMAFTLDPQALAPFEAKRTHKGEMVSTGFLQDLPS